MFAGESGDKKKKLALTFLVVVSSPLLCAPSPTLSHSAEGALFRHPLPLHMLASDSAASKAVARTGYAAWRLTRSTGKAAWIAVTTFLVLAVPLIIELDREAQLVEFESQQLGALTAKDA